jgi:DNA invertase Pin-like site-specific DNA recombinase
MIAASSGTGGNSYRKLVRTGGGMTGKLIPAAQYLRMSTEHQQYSLQNQSATIRSYAESHGFEVVRTYSDEAKTGMVLKYRAGLQQLLRDVVGGTSECCVILVYDVSRWGRFQDTDESAHYEFLCKSAGVPVHYCAEIFANDGSLPNLIMKALKRTMAGEYSRELGVKTYAGQKRLALLGFKQGGVPGYGLRRMLVSASGVPKQELALRERKSIATDRVILVPGPAHEVQTVKEIYRMLISEKRSICAIARKLNRDGVPRVGDSKWDHYAVREILTHPKYAGYAVFGRTSSKLYTPIVKLAKSEWIMRPGAFEPIVDATTFAEAQKAYAGRTFKRTDEELLNDLRGLLNSEGRLSLTIIKNAAKVVSPGTYRHRFGSLRNVYGLIGYNSPGRFSRVDTRNRTQAMRSDLMARIVAIFPNEVSIISPGIRWRGRLRLNNGLIVSVLVSRSEIVWKQTRRWRIDPVPRERKFVTLLARLDPGNRSFVDFHVFPNMDHANRFQISLTDCWLNRGKRLNDLSQIMGLLRWARAARKRKRL